MSGQGTDQEIRPVHAMRSLLAEAGYPGAYVAYEMCPHGNAHVEVDIAWDDEPGDDPPESVVDRAFDLTRSRLPATPCPCQTIEGAHQ